mgnify:CR=1 FL=1
MIGQSIHSRDSILDVLERFATAFQSGGSTLLRVVRVNGLPGFTTREANVENPTTALEFEKDAIRAIHVVRNPAKLRHLPTLFVQLPH